MKAERLGGILGADEKRPGGHLVLKREIILRFDSCPFFWRCVKEIPVFKKATNSKFEIAVFVVVILSDFFSKYLMLCRNCSVFCAIGLEFSYGSWLAPTSRKYVYFENQLTVWLDWIFSIIFFYGRFPRLKVVKTSRQHISVQDWMTPTIVERKWPADLCLSRKQSKLTNIIDFETIRSKWKQTQ